MTDRVDVDREDWAVVDSWMASALEALKALKLKPQVRRLSLCHLHTAEPTHWSRRLSGSPRARMCFRSA